MHNLFCKYEIYFYTNYKKEVILKVKFRNSEKSKKFNFFINSKNFC